MSTEKVNEQKHMMALGALGLSGLLIVFAWTIVGANEFIDLGEEYTPVALDIANRAAIGSTALLGVSSLAYVAGLVSNFGPRPKKISFQQA